MLISCFIDYYRHFSTHFLKVYRFCLFSEFNKPVIYFGTQTIYPNSYRTPHFYPPPLPKRPTLPYKSTKSHPIYSKHAAVQKSLQKLPHSLILQAKVRITYKSSSFNKLYLYLFHFHKPC